MRNLRRSLFFVLHAALVFSYAVVPASARQDSAAAAESAETVYTRDEVSKPAVIIERPDPAYKKVAGRLDVSGTVRVEMVLSSSGKVADAEVVAGLSPAQNLAALKAARRIKFMPAFKDGRPVSQAYTAEYSFQFINYENGSTDELKGVRKVYVDPGVGAKIQREIIGEILKELPELEIVDAQEGADCLLIFSTHQRVEVSETEAKYGPQRGKRGYNMPLKVAVGRGWVVRPVSADRQRTLMYFEDTHSSFVEKEPSINFARAFVKAYRQANGPGSK